LTKEDCKHFNSHGFKGKTCKGEQLYIDKLQYCGPLLFIIQQHLSMNEFKGTTSVDWDGLREAFRRIRDGEPKSTERKFEVWFMDTFGQAFVNEVTYDFPKKGTIPLLLHPTKRNWTVVKPLGTSVALKKD